MRITMNMNKVFPIDPIPFGVGPLRLDDTAASSSAAVQVCYGLVMVIII